MPSNITIGSQSIDISPAAIEALSGNKALAFEEQVRAALTANGVPAEQIEQRVQAVTGLVGYFLEHGDTGISETERAFIERFLNGTATDAEMAQAYNIFRLTNPTKDYNATPPNPAYSWFSTDNPDNPYQGSGLSAAMGWTGGADHPAIGLFDIANRRDEGAETSYADSARVTLPDGTEVSMFQAMSQAYASIPPNAEILAAVQLKILDDIQHNPAAFPVQPAPTLDVYLAAIGIDPQNPASLATFLDPDGYVHERGFGGLPEAEAASRGEILFRLLNEGAITAEFITNASNPARGGTDLTPAQWYDCALANYFHANRPENFDEFRTLVSHLRGLGTNPNAFEPGDQGLEVLKRTIDQYFIQYGSDMAALRSDLDQMFDGLPVDQVSAIIANPDRELAFYGLTRFPTEVGADPEAAFERGALNDFLADGNSRFSPEEKADILSHIWQNQNWLFPDDATRQAFERQVLPDLTAAIIRDINDTGDRPKAEDLQGYLAALSGNPELLYKFLQELRAQDPALFNEVVSSDTLAPYAATLNDFRNDAANGVTQPDFLSPLLPDAYLGTLVRDGNYEGLYNHLLTNRGTDIATSRTWQDFRTLYITGHELAAQTPPVVMNLITHMLNTHPEQLTENSVLDEALSGLNQAQLDHIHTQLSADGTLTPQELSVLRLAYDGGAGGLQLPSSLSVSQIHAVVGSDAALLAHYGINPNDAATLGAFGNQESDVNEGQVLAYLVSRNLVTPAQLSAPGAAPALTDLAGYYRYGTNQDELEALITTFRADGPLSAEETAFLERIFASGDWTADKIRAALPSAPPMTAAELIQILDGTDGTALDAEARNAILGYYGINTAAAGDDRIPASVSGADVHYLLTTPADGGILGIETVAGDATAITALRGYYLPGHTADLEALIGRFGNTIEGAEQSFLTELFASGDWTPELIRQAIPDGLPIDQIDTFLNDSQLLGYYGIASTAGGLTFASPAPGGAQLHYLLTRDPEVAGFDMAGLLGTPENPGNPAITALRDFYINEARAGAGTPNLDAALARLDGAAEAQFIRAMFQDGTLIAYLGPGRLLAGTPPLIDTLNAALEPDITAFQLATELPALVTGSDTARYQATLNTISGLYAAELAAALDTDAAGLNAALAGIFTNQSAADVATDVEAIRNLKLSETLALLPADRRDDFLRAILNELGLDPANAAHTQQIAGLLAAADISDTDAQTYLGLGADNAIITTLKANLGIAQIANPVSYSSAEVNAYAVNVVEEILEGNLDYLNLTPDQAVQRLADMTAVSVGRHPDFAPDALGGILAHFTEAPYYNATATNPDAHLEQYLSQLGAGFTALLPSVRAAQGLPAVTPPALGLNAADLAAVEALLPQPYTAGTAIPSQVTDVLVTKALRDGDVPGDILINAIRSDYMDLRAEDGIANPFALINATGEIQHPAADQVIGNLQEHLGNTAHLAATLADFGFRGTPPNPNALDADERDILALTFSGNFIAQHPDRLALLDALGGVEGILALQRLGGTPAILDASEIRAFFETGSPAQPDYALLAQHPDIVTDLIQQNAFGTDTAAQLSGILNQPGLDARAFLTSLASEGLSRAQFDALLDGNTTPATLLAALLTTHDFDGTGPQAAQSLLNPDDLSDAQKAALVTHFATPANLTALTADGLNTQELALLQTLTASDPAFTDSVAPIILTSVQSRLDSDATFATQFFSDFEALFFNGDQPRFDTLAASPEALLFYLGRTGDGVRSLTADQVDDGLRTAFTADTALYENLLAEIGADGTVDTEEMALLQALGTEWFPNGYDPATTLPVGDGSRVTIGELLNFSLAGGPYTAAQLQEYAEEYLAVPGGELPDGLERPAALANLSRAIVASSGNAEVAASLETLFATLPDADRSTVAQALTRPAPDGLGVDGFKALIGRTAASEHPDLGALLALLQVDHDNNAGTALFSPAELQALWPSVQDDFTAAFTATPAPANQLDTVHALADFGRLMLGAGDGIPGPLSSLGTAQASFQQAIDSIPAQYLDDFIYDLLGATRPLSADQQAWVEANILPIGLNTAQYNELLREGVVTGTLYNENIPAAIAEEFTALNATAPSVGSVADAQALAREAYRLLDMLPDGTNPGGLVDEIVLTIPPQFRDDFLNTLLTEYAADNTLNLSDAAHIQQAQQWLSRDVLLGGTPETNRLLASENAGLLFELMTGAPLGDADPTTHAADRNYAFDRSGIGFINPADVLNNPTLAANLLTALNAHHNRDGGTLSATEAVPYAQDLAALGYSYLLSNSGATLNHPMLEAVWDSLRTTQSLDDYFAELKRLYDSEHPDATDQEVQAWLARTVNAAGLTESQLRDLIAAGIVTETEVQAALTAVATPAAGQSIEGYYEVDAQAPGEQERPNCIEQIFGNLFGRDDEEVAVEQEQSLMRQLGDDSKFIISSFGDNVISTEDLVIPQTTPALTETDGVRLVGGLRDFDKALRDAAIDTNNDGRFTAADLTPPAAGAQDRMNALNAAFTELAGDIGAGGRLSFSYGNPATTVNLKVGEDGRFYPCDAAGTIAAGAQPYNLTPEAAEGLFTDATARQSQLASAGITNPYAMASMTVTMASGVSLNTDAILTYGMLQQVQTRGIAVDRLFDGEVQQAATAYGTALQAAREAER